MESAQSEQKTGLPKRRTILELKEEADRTGENIYDLLKKEGYIADPIEDFKL